jgi:membrane dipeptidase
MRVSGWAAALVGLSAAIACPRDARSTPQSAANAANTAVDDKTPLYVVDMHVDVPWQVHVKGRDVALREGHITTQTLLAAPYIGLVLPIYISDKSHKDGGHIADADAIFTTVERITAAHQDLFLPLNSANAKEGRISTFLAIEGAGAFAEDVTAIDRFIERGLRFVSPCHAGHSKLASSATGKQKVDFGLTDTGKVFAERVYSKGALIDVSHVSDKAFDDIAEIAKKHDAPIVATHSNARKIANVPRNLTDAQLKTLGDSGGVVGANFYSQFVNGAADATLEDLVKQILHMVKVAGIDHVGIGSDYDGGITPVVGMDDASGFPKLAAALKAKGLSHEDVMKIFSLNALRVLGWRSVTANAPGPAPDSRAP